MTENNQQLTGKYQPKIKVCGLTQMNQIPELVSMNVDFLGFIFYKKSPRYVLNHLDTEDISEIPHQGKTGVFVNEGIEKIVAVSEEANLNFIQLHGFEGEDFIAELKQRINPEMGIIKAIRIGDQNSDELQEIIDRQPPAVNYLLFDTDSKAFGGTGKTFDWNLLNGIAISKPYFLSGGISEENTGNVQRLDQLPFALDINSKFESEPGIKDLEKIKKFLSTQ